MFSPGQASCSILSIILPAVCQLIVDRYRGIRISGCIPKFRSFRASAHTGVGISIDFRTAYRHTDCPILPFFGVYPREVALLTGGLPHQSEDWFAMTGNSIPHPSDRQILKFMALLFYADNRNRPLFGSPRSGTASQYLISNILYLITVNCFPAPPVLRPSAPGPRPGAAPPG